MIPHIHIIGTAFLINEIRKLYIIKYTFKHVRLRKNNPNSIYPFLKISDWAIYFINLASMSLEIIFQNMLWPLPNIKDSEPFCKVNKQTELYKQENN